VSVSHALRAATERLRVIAAVLPGPWHPALLTKQIATISHLTNGRVDVNVVSGWFRGEFSAIGESWLDHDEPTAARKSSSAPSVASGRRRTTICAAISTASPITR
jgi:alkanesulfonate monooxygenase SsuD/methylene tetrahydromethanopterin reductase-like flavin-dependent oxidoreductase (luciferase family)